MTREEKNKQIEDLMTILGATNNLYIADTSGLNAEQTSDLRRACFKADIEMTVVKNALLKKAMERSPKNFDDIYEALKGNSSIMISEVGNAPAKLIKDFRKKSNKPLLKAAYIDEAIFVGDNQLDTLVNLKSKNELIGEIILLLESPMKNVISALQGGGGQTIAGLLKTLEERKA
ncbi:MAG: 50S ribosomal protein L10 [Schleiferiaceae bacterium]|jgi:large subunit ribosomal protein L10|nr:50S ribosomal protein L10 [Schleiferiaceae bacterium]MDP4629086.1 50S ribosomal protein L10 [Schleiferiaceae bacterium]MDP4773246.1 50S ribosomal protein L10 [Schleiferiaceae bacterium]MDP4932838.1 50S ribosomal protein L10 [Schleiferiaceae bacterium]